ncbi:MAG: CoA-binding protein, partial [Kiloniellales bacterium]|nr:CoA-binding protein [Kiloniellales bacterium]
MTASHRLSPLLTPGSIALVGASPRPGSVGDMMVRTLTAGGFPGELNLINPRYEQIGDQVCLKSLSALKRPPDLVVAATASTRLEELFEEAIALGARAITVFDKCRGAAGNGQPLGERLRDLSQDADLPVCGGNAMGFLNLTDRCHISFYPAGHLKPGGISLIAHSGSVFTVLALNDPRYRFDLLVSPGEEIGASIDEYIEFCLCRAQTKVIALFMESARNPDAFAKALERAAERSIPVVVCKVGRTSESARLAKSHSGALTGNDAAFQALLKRFNAISVDTVDQLMDTALLLSQGRSIGPGGPAFVTDSGGMRESLIDRAGSLDLKLGRFSAKTKAGLRRFLPESLPVSNPLDAAGPIVDGFSAPFRKSLQLIGKAEEISILGFEFDGRDDYLYDPELLKTAEDLAKMTDKPCFVYSSFSHANNRALADRLADLSLPLINGLDNTLLALKHFHDWRDRRWVKRSKESAELCGAQESVASWRDVLCTKGSLN